MPPMLEAPDIYGPPPGVSAALIKLGVDKGQIALLARYVMTLDRWRQRINLIGPADIVGIWFRHVLDSAQIWPYIKDPNVRVLDLGSGAGLPGLVLAVLGAGNVTLVDSDQRKGVFLREAARELGVRPVILSQRFDDALLGRENTFEIVTGRAVAPLSKLAPTVFKALTPGGYALLHKGAQCEKELTETRKSWTMQSVSTPSLTGSGGVLLKIWGLQRHDGSA